MHANKASCKDVKNFELAIKNICNLKKEKTVVAVSTGHAALHLSLMILGIKNGDEVITPSFNNAADFQAIKACGANPVFVDINPKTGLMCIESLKTKLVEAEKSNKLPKIVIPVHLSGSCCDMKRIGELSKKFGFDDSSLITKSFSRSMLIKISQLCTIRSIIY